jgi:hypothetical protein
MEDLKYLFCIFKNANADTSETNFQRACHANIQNIIVNYAGQQYPNLAQECDWNRNQYSIFYNQFTDVAHELGFSNPSLSMKDFRDLYTIYSINMSNQPSSTTSSMMTINITRREVPQDGHVTLMNPTNLQVFYVILSECEVEIDPIKKLVKKL